MFDKVLNFLKISVFRESKGFFVSFSDVSVQAAQVLF